MLEGVALTRAPGRFGFMTPEGMVTVDSASVARVESDPDPAGMYLEAKRAFTNRALVPPAADRYSGLPGSLNVLWLDHLRGRRPAAFLGVKERSYALRYALVPRGLVDLAVPREDVPPVPDQARDALAVFARFRTGSAFRSFDPWSFEAENVPRLDAAARRTAALLERPECAALVAADPPGLRALRAYLDRARAVRPTPAPPAGPGPRPLPGVGPPPPPPPPR